MDVLVYTGQAATKSSSENVVNALRALLLPNYTIQTITLQGLKTQPWFSSCALLVFPQSFESFQSPAATVIKNYVESGGSFLLLGSGANCSSRDEGVIPGVAKDLQLRFYDKPSAKYIYPTFSLKNDQPKPLSLRLWDDRIIHGIYNGGSNALTGFEGNKNTTVLGRYLEGDTTGNIAAIKCDIGNGRIALWTTSLASSIGERGASSLEEANMDLLRETLRSLALRVPFAKPEVPTHPLPQFLTSNPSKPGIIGTILDLIAAPLPSSQLKIFEDSNDNFEFHTFEESKGLIRRIRNEHDVNADLNKLLKHIIICRGTLPSRDDTPLFDVGLYYESLNAARTKRGCRDFPNSWGLGEALLYSEAVTSTQTLLDKNPRLLSRLPTPLVSLASYQLAGRGRGGNVWISQSGGLQFSVSLRVSLSSFPASKLVFVQYLFALAVVQACRDESVLGPRGDNIRLKWPNDLYAVAGPEPNQRMKIGGILVNTSFNGGTVDIVIGCGVNVANAPPVFSLAQLLPGERQANINVEKTVAAILSTFEVMWDTFVAQKGSFDSFMDLYLQRWLHSDQLVTLTTVNPHKLVRITGITPDHGLLRTLPERTGWSSEDGGFIDLQPDGNSFDLMAGLIKSKT